MTIYKQNPLKKVLFLLFGITLLIGMYALNVTAANEYKYYRIYVNTSGAQYGEFDQGAWCFDNNGTNIWKDYGQSIDYRPLGGEDVGWTWGAFQTVALFTNPATVLGSQNRPYLKVSTITAQQPNVWVGITLDTARYCKVFNISNFIDGSTAQLKLVSIKGSNDNSTFTDINGTDCTGKQWCIINNPNLENSSSPALNTTVYINFSAMRLRNDEINNTVINKTIWTYGLLSNGTRLPYGEVGGFSANYSAIRYRNSSGQTSTAGAYNGYVNLDGIVGGFYNINQQYQYQGVYVYQGTEYTTIWYNFTFDNNSPTGYMNPNNLFDATNTSVFYKKRNQNYTLNFSFLDNIYLNAYSFNFTNSTGESVLYVENLTVGGTFATYSRLINFLYSNFTFGTVVVRTLVSDGHTDADWKADGVTIDDRKGEIVVDTKEGNRLTTSVDAEATVTFIEKKDRVSDIYTFADKTIKTVEFTFKADTKIKYVDKPNIYDAWFIVPDASGVGGNWRDFECKDADGKEVPVSYVYKVSDYEYRIVIANVGEKLSCESIGGLNIFGKDYSFTIYNFETNNVSIFPLYTAISEQDINGYANVSMSNTSALNIEYFLYKNNNVIRSGNYSNAASNQNVLIDTLDNSYTSVGDNITFVARAWYQSDYGDYKNSTTTRIYNLTINNCSVNPGIPSNYTALNISFINPDGTPATVNLSTLISYGYGGYTYGYYSNVKNINNATYCIYPNVSNVYASFNFIYIDIGGTYYYNNPSYVFNQSMITTYLYVTTGSSQTTFTIKDAYTNKVLPDTLCISYLQIGIDYNSVESKLSDITGKIIFNYLPNNNYKFMCSKNGYTTNVFYLTPPISAYDVPMIPTSILNQTQDYDRVPIRYYPTLFYNGDNNFTFLIGSLGELLSYGYVLTYPGGSSSNAGTTANGEQLYSNFTITGATVNDYVYLTYYYDKVGIGNKTFKTSFAISVPQTNYTMAGNPNNRTYGLGILERVLIVVMIMLLVAGISALRGQVVMGGILALLIMGFLTYTGFISVWVTIITGILGAIIIFMRQDY